MTTTVQQTTIEVIDGSIATMAVDAIVNAATPTLAAGGGVDGAIHAAAGPELKAACLAFPEVRPAVRCEAGATKVTPGFKLQAKYVIHTVGPVWWGGDRGESEQLARCYRGIVEEVSRLGIASVAIPALGTGAYGYPAHLAAVIAVHEIVAFAKTRTSPLRIVFACLGVKTVRFYTRALAAELPLPATPGLG